MISKIVDYFVIILCCFFGINSPWPLFATVNDVDMFTFWMDDPLKFTEAKTGCLIIGLRNDGEFSKLVHSYCGKVQKLYNML